MVFKRLLDMFGVSKKLERWSSNSTMISLSSSSSLSFVSLSSDKTKKKRFFSLSHFRKESPTKILDLKHAKEEVEVIDEIKESVIEMPLRVVSAGLQKTAKMSVYAGERKSLQRVHHNSLNIMHARKQFNFSRASFVHNSDRSLIFRKVASFN